MGPTPDNGKTDGARSERAAKSAARSAKRPARGRHALPAWKTAARAGALALVAGLCGVAARAQQGPGAAGPQVPAVKPPAIVRVPNTPPAAEKPPIPEEELIRRFAAAEDQLALAAQRYVYRKTVRLEEFGPDGKASGQAEIVTTPTTGADGRRYQRATGEQQSTLQFVDLNRDQLQALTQIPAFPLTTPQLSKYRISYEGTEQVDELMTYIFRVTPLQVERAQPYFDGLVWVDNHDLAIVKTYGKWMTETGPVSPPNLPFTMYEMYREPVDKTYWLPAYSRSDGTVMTRTGSVAVRLVIRWDQYAVAPAGTAAAPAGAAAPGAAATADADRDPNAPRLERNPVADNPSAAQPSR